MGTCLIALLSICNATPTQMVLSGIHGAVAYADTYTTQRNLSLGAVELNPLTRSLQMHGKPLAYASTTAGVLGVSWIANRMKHSNNRIINKIWWVPQVTLTVGSAYGTAYNLQKYSRRAR